MSRETVTGGQTDTKGCGLFQEKIKNVYIQSLSKLLQTANARVPSVKTANIFMFIVFLPGK